MLDLDSGIGILCLFFVIAAIYSSVGHGGATGYLALFALIDAATVHVVPIALILNVVVAGVGCWIYFRNGHLRPSLLLPFVLASIPAAYVGGSIRLEASGFQILLGVLLLLAGTRLLLSRWIAASHSERMAQSRVSLSIAIGLVLGLVSGMIGIGGGVFLSPVILMLGWANARQTAAVSSAFIVLNSLSGLVAHLARGNLPMDSIAILGAVVLAGGVIGSTLGARYIRIQHLQALLGAVLLFAGGKLLYLAVC